MTLVTRKTCPRTGRCAQAHLLPAPGRATSPSDGAPSDNAAVGNASVSPYGAAFAVNGRVGARGPHRTVTQRQPSLTPPSGRQLAAPPHSQLHLSPLLPSAEVRCEHPPPLRPQAAAAAVHVLVAAAAVHVLVAVAAVHVLVAVDVLVAAAAAAAAERAAESQRSAAELDLARLACLPVRAARRRQRQRRTAWR